VFSSKESSTIVLLPWILIESTPPVMCTRRAVNPLPLMPSNHTDGNSGTIRVSVMRSPW